MLKKKISFVTYTVIITALILAMGISCLLIIQNNLMKDDMNHTAYEMLTQEVRQVRRYIAYDSDKKPHIDSSYYDREEDSDSEDQIYVFLQGNDGELLDGGYPEGYTANPDISGKTIEQIDAGDEEYFAVIRKGRSADEKLQKASEYKICVMVSVRDIERNYRNLLYKSYIVIGIVVIAFAVYAIALRRLVAAPMKSLNRSIEKSVDDLDFTEKLQYDGPFRELDMLTDANNNLYEKVQQELERQSEFNANVSHELRTPVAVMHAQCQLSRELAEKNGDEEMLESIGVFERQTSRMKGLIEQLLQMSVMNKDNAVIAVEDVDLLDVVESVCDDVEYICKKKLQFSYDLKSTVVKANMNHIVIVVNNLMSNAVKYSSDGGKIRVSCGSKNGSCFISVRDDGCGMDKSTKEKIFESFYRGEPDRSTEGYGLGLSQVMQIARYYGGTVDVDSEVGKGSRFTFKIPCEQ